MPPLGIYVMGMWAQMHNHTAHGGAACLTAAKREAKYMPEGGGWLTTQQKKKKKVLIHQHGQKAKLHCYLRRQQANWVPTVLPVCKARKGVTICLYAPTAKPSVRKLSAEAHPAARMRSGRRAAGDKVKALSFSLDEYVTFQTIKLKKNYQNVHSDHHCV